MCEADYIGHPLHADSGGLQIVTRGHAITSDVKKGVYKSQALHSGIAMCFDEIPVTTSAGGSKIGDTTSRFFDRSLVSEKAKHTAENIVEQANYFASKDTKAKIMIIVQGYDYDSYQAWMNEMVNTIPKELYPYICGLAIAGSSSGSGQLEDVERAWTFARLECPDEWKNRLHLLGVGACRRMAPFTALGPNLYNNCTISYDSTTHSNNVSMRTFKSEDISGRFTNLMYGFRTDQIMKVYDIVKNTFPFIDIDYAMYEDMLNFNRESFIDKYTEDKLPLFHQGMIATCLSSVLKTADTINQMTDPKKYKKFCATDKKTLPLMNLVEVKDENSYNSYMRDYGKFLKSVRIAEVNDKSSLEAFF